MWQENKKEKKKEGKGHEQLLHTFFTLLLRRAQVINPPTDLVVLR